MKKNVGEVFSIEREEYGGTGYSYNLVKLEAGLALLYTDTAVQPPSLAGGPVKRSFYFVGLKPGKATLQLAKFRVFDLSDILYEKEITVEILSPQGNANTVGGWAEQRPLTKEDQAVFDEAMKGFVGVGYKPKSVATQVVAGVNYRFICDAQPVYPGARPYEAMVEIYKPLEGSAVITHISRIPD